MPVLEELHVRDLALIDEVWLEFGPGMTVLTGETGAGKTALLGALKLLIGERADSSTVRSGADETVIEGRFGGADGEEIVVRRRVGADGRSRCWMDGAMATVGELARSVGPLVDLHGQHEHQALLSPATHVGYLDRWAGEAVTEALGRYREARAAYRAAVAERDELAARVERALADADELRRVAAEIEQAAPRPGEDDELRERLPALENAGQLAEAAAEATALLRADGGALDRIGMAAHALDRLAGIDPELDSMAVRLLEAQTLTDDVSAALRQYRDSVDHDPAALDEAQARIATLSGLMKRFGPTLDDVIERGRRAGESLAAAGDGGRRLASAQAAVDAARECLRETADRLDAARRAAVPGFVDALEAAVADLAMDGARFEVRFSEREEDAWTDDGPARVDFRYSAAAGHEPRPLARIASGGELSRVMLALKRVLGSADEVETLVFDEVDAGIGGATALAVGRSLKELAGTHQVIVVTHLAQVAAFADDQLVVRRSAGTPEAATVVERVEGDRRVAEIARMLAGSDSETGLAHARELLEDARHGG